MTWADDETNRLRACLRTVPSVYHGPPYSDERYVFTEDWLVTPEPWAYTPSSSRRATPPSSRAYIYEGDGLPSFFFRWTLRTEQGCNAAEVWWDRVGSLGVAASVAGHGARLTPYAIAAVAWVAENACADAFGAPRRIGDLVHAIPETVARNVLVAYDSVGTNGAVGVLQRLFDVDPYVDPSAESVANSPHFARCVP